MCTLNIAFTVFYRKSIQITVDTGLVKVDGCLLLKMHYVHSSVIK